MTWARFDDTFPEDPRCEALVDIVGMAGLGLHMTAVCYSNRNLTDGVILKSRVLRMTTAKDDPAVLMEALIDCGIWADAGNSIELVGYFDWQPSREGVEKRRADTAERQERWRNASRNASRNTLQDAYPTRPDPKGRKGKGTARTSAGATAQPSLDDKPKRVRAPRPPKPKREPPKPKPAPIPPDERPTMLVIGEAQSEADLSRAWRDAHTLGREWTDVQTKAVRDRKIALGIIKDTAHATALPVVDGIGWVDGLHLP